MNETYIRNVIEAAMLAAGRPLQLAELAQLFEEIVAAHATRSCAQALKQLEADYEGRGIEVKETGNGFRIQVRREVASEIGRLWPERPPRYSRAMLETLALIAYRQPITRAEIESVRGVAVNPQIIKALLERNWVRVVGTRDVPGRPELLGTTREFLDYFGLKSLDELPPLAELQAMGDFNLQLDLAGTPSAVEASHAADVAEPTNMKLRAWTMTPPKKKSFRPRRKARASSSPRRATSRTEAPRRAASALQKVLARLGVGSRREAEEWIRAGRLTVNGELATLGVRVQPDDQLRLDGRLIRQRAAARPGVSVSSLAGRESSRSHRRAFPRSAGRRFIAVSPDAAHRWRARDRDFRWRDGGATAARRAWLEQRVQCARARRAAGAGVAGRARRRARQRRAARGGELRGGRRRRRQPLVCPHRPRRQWQGRAAAVRAAGRDREPGAAHAARHLSRSSRDFPRGRFRELDAPKSSAR